MLRVLAVDDEVPALEEIAYLLRQDSRIEHVATASDAVAALQDIVQIHAVGERLDGVFLDIRMPGLDGIDLARLLAGFPTPPRVVFVTAHDAAAVQAFELEAVDYLLKPVRPERLAEAVRRLDGSVQKRGEEREDVIPVELAGRTRFVSQVSVLYAEAKGDYVRLHTAEGGYLVRMSLAALARRWGDAGFIRIHRSTLVATRHISELRFDEGRAWVQVGGETLPVSRRHTREVRELLVRQYRPDKRKS
ncbi:LytR/AlgR family response regulator transcription factor [Bailinhaonella thermotolerans]|uniref:DNA-binding response regulator n=1 Tax=Bailinhaonella thermotolerans TaxID=1070861 RepID=A0A3A4ASV6_9ACTN|nr:LytTR family DNA-binding domain-containing protein [Bailinhaonella thermotolerans]RJL31385.1 DNA-binding response regulator [Bailinhaonella thermotolerans]